MSQKVAKAFGFKAHSHYLALKEPRILQCRSLNDLEYDRPIIQACIR